MSERQIIIRFVGKISWEGRSNGLPEKIYAFLIFPGAAERQFVINEIEKQSQAFAIGGGMSVQKDQGQIIDMRALPEDRIFVPMHWIAFIGVERHSLTNELSWADEHGVERFANGEEPPKQ